MNSTRIFVSNRLSTLSLGAALFFAGALAGNSQSIQHLSVAVAGGMPGTPFVTGVEPQTNGILVTWDGPSGYYQLFQRPGLESSWQALGARTNLARRALVSAVYSNAFFRVYGPAPQFAGSTLCVECHQPIYDVERQTPHAHALETLRAIHQDTNPSCLPCHTVGYGLNSGFVSQTATPQLAGVQCENCHSSAGNHAANPDDPIVRPRIELAATVCGGCHTDSHHPTFDEWKTSGHSQVVEDMNPAGRISSCGRCHSGSVRVSLINGTPLPNGDANMPITCAVCHDPHQTTANPAQLRNPTSSTADYFLSTSDNFSTKYNPNINICAQCHNHRGALWTSTSRPPHHSPQYNMLIGTVGEMTNGVPPNSPATHAFLEDQCVTCHMQTEEFVSETQPAVTGHRFSVDSFQVCTACHFYDPEGLVAFTQDAVASRIQDVKAALDSWATSKAPAALRDKYGVLAWEYTNPGELSTGTAGPTAAEQSLVPDNIKKARFDMYLVQNDGSYGVHNPKYSIKLLDTALTWVRQELNK